MATLLHLNVSPRGETSTSRRAGQLVREQLAAHHGELTVIERDLAANPLPPIDAAFTHANMMVAAKRHDADPATLKTWIDLVVRPERTFAGTSQGKQGLLRDRPVLAVVSCGGRFSDDAASQRDFFTPYLTYVLDTIGLKRVEVVRMESMARG